MYCINEKAVQELKQRLPDRETAGRLAETFRVLGDPTRVKIIYALSQRELCVCDLAAIIGMTQSAVSHQLRVLRNLRLVKYRKEGKIVYYSIDDHHILNLFNEGLEHISHN
ncbi:helix-turn-helix transcriptional regulator [bacterium]|nr:MAG: helix-turn-helix transcriptional regulator [bacterium]